MKAMTPSTAQPLPPDAEGAQNLQPRAPGPSAHRGAMELCHGHQTAATAAETRPWLGPVTGKALGKQASLSRKEGRTQA